MRRLKRQDEESKHQPAQCHSQRLQLTEIILLLEPRNRCEPAVLTGCKRAPRDSRLHPAQKNTVILLPATREKGADLRWRELALLSVESGPELLGSYSSAVINILCSFGFMPSGIIRGLCW